MTRPIVFFFPAGAMALARLNIPGLVLTAHHRARGISRAKTVTIQDVFDAVGANAAGKNERRGFD